MTSRNVAWAARAKSSKRWVTAALVLVATAALGGLTLSAFESTNYRVGSIERSYVALMASIGAGLVGGMLAWLIRRNRSRRAAIILMTFLVFGVGSGFVFGRWIGEGISLCVDGQGIRTGCGTPWFGTFMKPKYAGGAFAYLGGVVGLTFALLIVGVLAVLRRKRTARAGV